MTPVNCCSALTVKKSNTFSVDFYSVIFNGNELLVVNFPEVNYYNFFIVTSPIYLS